MHLQLNLFYSGSPEAKSSVSVRRVLPENNERYGQPRAASSWDCNATTDCLQPETFSHLLKNRLLQQIVPTIAFNVLWLFEEALRCYI